MAHPFTAGDRLLQMQLSILPMLNEPAAPHKNCFVNYCIAVNVKPIVCILTA